MTLGQIGTGQDKLGHLSRGKKSGRPGTGQDNIFRYCPICPSPDAGNFDPVLNNRIDMSSHMKNENSKNISKLNRPPYTPDRQMQAALERLPKRDKPRERLTGKEGPQGLQNRY